MYYIPSEHFDTTEARLLIDSVISAKFVTPNKTAILLEKLVRLTDRDMLFQYMKDIVVENRQKHRNCYSYYSIDVIQEALAKDRRINFKYFDLDENINKTYRHNGKIYEVCHITMINGMDNYYLIGYEPCSNSSREKTFRIDRMADTALSSFDVPDDLYAPRAAKTVVDGLSGLPTFYIDDRKKSKGVVSVICLDRLAFADIDFPYTNFLNGKITY